MTLDIIEWNLNLSEQYIGKYFDNKQEGCSISDNTNISFQTSLRHDYGKF